MSPEEQRASTIPPPPRTIKACGCGRAFNVHEWRELRLVGYQDDGDGGELELRDCPCASTIAIEIPHRQDGDRAPLVPEREAPRSAVRLCPVGIFSR